MDVRPGYKLTEIGVIPEDWSLRQLGDVVTFLDGRRRPVKDADRANMRGTIPYYGASGIVDYVNDYLFDEDLILLGEDGENILSRNRRLAFRIAGKAWVNNHAHVLKPIADVSIGFLTDSLESLNYEQFNSGTAQPKLNKQTCIGIPIPLPPTLAEQEAIAEALSDADALIESLEQLLTKKRQIKKGAMQELLTGKKRLPGFNREWRVKRLGEVAEIVMGQSPSSAHYNNRGEGLPLIQGNADISNRQTIRRVFTTEVTKRGHPGDILMSVRAPVGEVSRMGFDVCLGRGVCAIRCSETDFLYYALVAREPTWANLSKGSTFDSVSSTDVERFEIEQPTDETEQRAIATILFDMDAEIAALQAKLSKARQIKQGMMQELLTGRVRLV